MITYNVEQAKKAGMKVGEGTDFIDIPNFGSEPYLIEIGSRTTISFDVAFVNHDGGTRVIRKLPGQNKETVIYGKIVIGDNCFIGCRTTLLPGIHIGDNTIIGAGSVVTHDIPANSVACGAPCKVICSIEEYIAKHRDEFEYMVSLPWDKKKEYLLKKFAGDEQETVSRTFFAKRR